MSKADLLLVNTPLAPSGSHGAPRGALYPPLATLVLGSHVRAAGHVVTLLDPTVEPEVEQRPTSADDALELAAAEIVRRSPRVVGVTTMGAVEGGFAIALARRLAEAQPDVPVILGGSWATGAAEQVLARWPWIDAVALGAAERAVVEGLEAGLGRTGRDLSALEAVQGWATRRADGAVVSTGGGRPIEPRDSVPLDLGLLGRPDAYDTMVYLTSRGCPFHCAFCTEPYMAQGPFDEPLEKVTADLEAFDRSLDVSYLWLCDPLFGASRRRLDEVLEPLRRSPLSFLFESRVDTLDPEAIPDIRAAGGDLVYLGLEAVTTPSLLRIDKVPSEAAARRYRERALAVVEACAANDVLPVLGVLEPVPGATENDLAETLEWLAEADRIAAAAAEEAGTAVRPFFHAFPYRIDPGTTAAARAEDDAARWGTTCTAPADSLLCEREVCDASHHVGQEAAARFRAAVRALNRGGPAVLGRALRSMPRPFLADRWSDEGAAEESS